MTVFQKTDSKSIYPALTIQKSFSNERLIPIPGRENVKDVIIDLSKNLSSQGDQQRGSLIRIPISLQKAFLFR